MPQQAFSPTYRPQSRGGYQQPRQGSSKLYYTDGTKIPGARIDASVKRVTLMGGPSEGPIAQRGQMWSPTYKPQTRQGNIDAARADGSFDAKRNAFNAANKGSFMDESGKIGPKAPLPTGSPSNERVPVPAATSPTAATAAKPAPQMMGPPRPATFEGKSRAEWFGAAAQRQKQGNAYSNEAIAQAKPAAPAATVASQPFKPAPLPGPAPAGTKEPPRPLSSPAPIVAPAGSPVAASPVVASQKATTPAASAPASKASWFSNATQAAVNGATAMMTDRAAKEKRIADLEQQAKPGMQKVAEAAKGAAVGAAMGAQLPTKAIATPVQATIAGAQEAGRKIGETVNSAVQGVKNFMQGDQGAADEAEKLKEQLKAEGYDTRPVLAL